MTASPAPNPTDMTGHVAIVTGAGSGIGRASALALAAAGASVVCADLDGDAAAVTAEQARSATGVALDVRDRAAVEAVVQQTVEHRGRLDAMCNIAGTMIEARILDVTEDALDGIMAVNLKGVLWGCQAAGRVMAEQGSGSIVNMASAAVLTPTPDVGPYAMTKAAVVQLTTTLATELGPSGVRVNAVAPGFVITKLTSRYWTRPDGSVDEDLRDKVTGPLRRFTPLRRLGEPEEIANTVLFLASDASSYTTGQLLGPHGGVAMP